MIARVQQFILIAAAALCQIMLVSCTSGFQNTNMTAVETITAMSGTPQSHAIGGAFAVPLVATVIKNGSPLSGVAVTFTAPSNGPSGTFADTGSATTTIKTDANGLATSTGFIANKTAGNYEVTASTSGVSSTASFSLINTTAAPSNINISAGASQSAALNSAFPIPLTVTVIDSGQNPVQNAAVTFQAPASGASGTFADTGTNVTNATTNTSGTATSSIFTSNSVAGPVTITVTVAGVGQPAMFTLTNLAGTPASVIASSGTPQSTTISTPFAAPLVANVLDSFSNPVSGVAVTFTGPSTGASGTFANGSVTETDITDGSGMATSSVFTANATTGGPYVVTAAVAGLATSASFTLTNNLASRTYVFYLNGTELNTSSYYALAGAVQIDIAGNVLGGEQDYNDGQYGITSPQPSGDAITGGTLKVNANSGRGILTLITNNPAVGASGTETFTLQFLNVYHAAVLQFDGTATSAGSMDMQNLSTGLDGGYAFYLAGLDASFLPSAFGGVFSISGGATLQNGIVDFNDAGTIATGTALTGTLSTPDAYGRGTITSNLATNAPDYNSTPIALNYYIVGPEVMRIIDVDTTDSAVGAAFGQGVNASAATNASLPNSVFTLGEGIGGLFFSNLFAAAGMIETNAGTLTGIGDEDEIMLVGPLSGSPLTGSYSVSSNGYGTLTIDPGELGDVSALGLYMTDPQLNLNDPNNTATGTGGAVLLDLDALLAGGTGFAIPQTDTAAKSLKGKYGFWAQGYNFLDASGESDFLGNGTVSTNGAFSGIGNVSDPFFTFGANATNTSVTFTGSPLPDSANRGRYTLSVNNPTPNPLELTIAGTPWDFDVAIYQANGNQLVWVNTDATSIFLGFLESMGSLNGLSGASAAHEASVQSHTGLAVKPAVRRPDSVRPVLRSQTRSTSQPDLRSRR